MGLKRPFDEDELHEFPIRHPKQHDCGNKLTAFAENFPSYEASQEAEMPGMADKEFENCTPSSWATSTTSEEDAGSAFCSFSSDYFEINFPRRTYIQFEDTYSSLLNFSPRKEIPLGPNHQADIPAWDPEVMKKHSLLLDDISVDNVTGHSAIATADSKSLVYDHIKDTNYSSDCCCSDEGSIRCVRQHVKEARENLKDELGDEGFVHLGFAEMGEEVARKWTKEEELVFHEVVYSSPASLGKSFWKHLAVVFPSRTKMELVSYYFNVFMLWRRAVQNRSHLLEIDSDDDEWQGNDRGAFAFSGEDDDSAVESFVDQDIRGDLGFDSLDENNYHDDEDDDDGDSDARVSGAYDIKEDVGRGHKSKAEIEKSDDDNRLDFIVHNVDKIPGSTEVYFDVEQDSCMSYEGQPHTSASIQGSRVRSDHGGCFPGDVDGSDDSLGAEYVLEPCDLPVWDDTYSLGLMKGVDLLSTCNMIEEIFGPTSTWNPKSRIDESIR